MNTGKIVSIQITPELGKPLENVPSVQAVAGQGLEGDRYFADAGTFSKKKKPSQEITLIEIEALEALQRDYGLELSPAESRRNLATRGVALNHLVGKEFKVGPVVLRGIKLCEPCGHLEKLTGRSVREGLIHRGGLRAQILVGGQVQVGDPVELVPA
jgi:MOSC domain-containing protein YiiM